MVAVCSPFSGFRAEESPLEPAQGDRNMDVVTVGVAVTGSDPGRAHSRKTHEFQLREDDAGPRRAAGDKPLGQRKGHVEDARAGRDPIHPVPQDHGARSRDRAADELGALSKVVIWDNCGRLMKCVVRAHESGALQLAEFLGERIKAACQLLQTLRVGIEGVEREADPSDHLGYDAGSKLGL